MALPTSVVASDDAIRVRDLRVRRGHHLVLPGVSLEVPLGVVTGLLGPSGSGKTTLMRAIVGVQVIEGGEVTVLGRPAGSKPLRTLVGYTTQAPSIYPDLTVHENLRYFARLLGVATERVEEVIDSVDLREQADQIVRTLSGGERSRASLAVALLGDPELLVLDEPTVGLDPLLRHDVWRLFHSLADRGVAVLVSTHVMDEADRCNRLVLMREGHIVASGSPDELRERVSATTMEEAFVALAAGS
ncbi:MAG: ABC transporter ATP-binding protein [Dehalococcoidia bacterium]|nr:ABC transporter ATP-binding protein [Dehalococcoidia bacterium]